MTIHFVLIYGKLSLITFWVVWADYIIILFYTKYILSDHNDTFLFLWIIILYSGLQTQCSVTQKCDPQTPNKTIMDSHSKNNK